MNTKKMKVLVTVLSALIMVAMLGTVVFADAFDDLSNASSNVDTSGINNIGKSIISILSTVGVVAAVIVLMVLGIKYMMGSAEEKAEYKKTMIPYVIGAVLIFGASSIAKIIYGIASGI